MFHTPADTYRYTNMNGDIRLSIPLCLFCLITLSVALFLAFDQSLNPPEIKPASAIKDTGSEAKSTRPADDAPHGKLQLGDRI